MDRDNARNVTRRWLEAADRLAVKVKPQKIRPEQLSALGFGFGFTLVERESPEAK